LEIIFVILIAFSSYLSAEVVKLSGIISILFCGMFMSHYTSVNISEYDLSDKINSIFFTYWLENLWWL
jgi:sodium/hydrogen exchanger 8